MKLIQENPYRIGGILANSSERELQRQKSKITKYASIGKKVAVEIDFPFLESLDRSESSITKAFSGIEQSQDKVSHSLFWFLKANTFDETAINYLINGDKEKAVEIWDKVTNGKEVTSKNFSCFNNIGTLKLLGDSKDEIKEGIEAKIKLIGSPTFEIFVHTVADQTYTIDNQKQTEKFLDDILEQFKGKYSNADTLELFSNCNGNTRKYLTQKFTEEPLHKIESKIDSCKKKRKENNGNAYEFGLNLFTNTKDDLKILESILGTKDYIYKMIADQLANEIMQCGIDYFKESQENNSRENYLGSSQKLIKLADSIAVGKMVQDRAKDTIATLEGIKDQEVKKAIALLKSVKDAYETNEQKIRLQVKELLENDPLIKLGHKVIDHFAVDESIKKSINWDKVNDLLSKVLSTDSLKKIKASTNFSLKAEFIELAYWLKDYSQKNSLIVSIISKYKKIPPSLPFTITSSEITNTDNKPLYTRFIRHIGLKLNLDVTEDMTMTIYVKYIGPGGSILRNSKTSPKGYTQTVTKTISRPTSEVIIPGWGNPEKCIYGIGKHQIDIYVDEYLIHTKKFTIDLAPSEKIEKEIITTEKKLKAIKQSNYFESEIKCAHTEMRQIQRFKLFRRSAEKKIQIEVQQTKIDSITEQAQEAKRKDIRTLENKIMRLRRKLSSTKY